MNCLLIGIQIGYLGSGADYSKSHFSTPIVKNALSILIDTFAKHIRLKRLLQRQSLQKFGIWPWTWRKWRQTLTERRGARRQRRCSMRYWIRLIFSADCKASGNRILRLKNENLDAGNLRAILHRPYRQACLLQFVNCAPQLSIVQQHISGRRFST